MWDLWRFFYVKRKIVLQCFLQCQPLLYSKVTQLYTYKHSFSVSFSTMVYHRIPNMDVKYIRTLFIHVVVCIYQPSTPNRPLSLPPPPQQPRVCSLCLSLFPFGRQVHLCHILDSTYKWYHMFSFWLTSLSMILSRCIHVAADGIILFFFLRLISTLAWKIPWTEEPGGLQSMGSLRVGHDWATSLSLFTFMHWRRKWQPTPVFLPGESQGWGSLAGCRLWGRTELDTTKAT